MGKVTIDVHTDRSKKTWVRSKTPAFFSQLPDDERYPQMLCEWGREMHYFIVTKLSACQLFVAEKGVQLSEIKNAPEQHRIRLAKKDKVQLALGEGLSAVVAVKRFTNTTGFSSTADIASMGFVTAMKKHHGENALRDFKGLERYIGSPAAIPGKSHRELPQKTRQQWVSLDSCHKSSPIIRN